VPGLRICSLVALFVSSIGHSKSICPSGWIPLEEDACLLRGKSPEVLLYFHGLMAPDTKAMSYELRFISQSNRREFNVVALRGMPGLCDWDVTKLAFWCWPVTPNRMGEVEQVIERVNAVMSEARERIRKKLRSPFLMGYSNGGFFLSLLLAETSFENSGAIILNGGTLAGISFEPENKTPVLLIGAAQDAIQLPSMRALEEQLRTAQWRPKFRLRNGGHPQQIKDFNEAFLFAQRQTKLSLRETVP
jgi:predicted esterase